jgi:hypothetical protein
MINEIRLCTIINGFGRTSIPDITITHGCFEPIVFLKFILKLINYIPLKILKSCDETKIYNIIPIKLL